MCFTIFRWGVALILGIFYSILLVLTIVITTIVLTFSDRANMKDWLQQTSLYESAFDIGINMVAENMEETADENNFVAKVGDPTSEVHQVVYDTITPQFIESSVNQVIDGMYDWVEGKTPTPVFVIQLANSDEELERIITLGFKEKVRGLPICQNMYDPPEDFDPLNWDCRPANYDVDQVENYIKEVSDTEDFQQFKDNFKIDSAELIKVSSDQSEQIQLGYQIFRYSPFILGLFSLLMGIFYAGMIPGRVRGLISMGLVTTLVGGIFLAFTFFTGPVLDYLYSDIMRNYITVESDEVFDLAQEVATNMVNGVAETLRYVSLGVAIVGFLLVIITYIVDIYKGQKERKVKHY